MIPVTGTVVENNLPLLPMPAQPPVTDLANADAAFFSASGSAARSSGFSGSTPSLKGLLRGLTRKPGATENEDGYFCPSKPFEITIVSGTLTDSTGLASLATDKSALCEESLKIDVHLL